MFRTRTARWSRPGNDGAAGKYRQDQIELSLFDMEKDPFETTNVIDKYPRGRRAHEGLRGSSIARILRVTAPAEKRIQSVSQC